MQATDSVVAGSAGAEVLAVACEQGRADMAALICLGVLYVPVPWILGAAGLDAGPALFLPGSLEWPWLNLVAAALQGTAGFVLLAWRWRGIQMRFEVTTGVLAD